jgi:hypothetical protein
MSVICSFNLKFGGIFHQDGMTWDPLPRILEAWVSILIAALSQTLFHL